MEVVSRVRRAGERLFGSLYVDLERDPRRSVFLAGSGRSGTTWLSEIINYRNEYRYVFEPFYPDRVNLCKSFRRKQYLRLDDRREEYLEPARTILSGDLRNLWTDRFNRKHVARRRLIKDIRANLLLGWMRANFPETPVILLLRHPCAVTDSRLKLGWKDILDDTMEQQDLVEDFLQPFEAEIRNARTPFERSIFLWCIENYVPLRQLEPESIHISFYESLCTQPEDELRRLFAFLGKGFDREVYRSMKRPSSLSRRESAVVLGERPVDSWTRTVSGARRERAVEILSLFGLDRIYDGSPFPDPGGVHGLMKTHG
jgi:hypothetical protein